MAHTPWHAAGTKNSKTIGKGVVCKNSKTIRKCKVYGLRHYLDIVLTPSQCSWESNCTGSVSADCTDAGRSSADCTDAGCSWERIKEWTQKKRKLHADFSSTLLASIIARVATRKWRLRLNMNIALMHYRKYQSLQNTSPAVNES